MPATPAAVEGAGRGNFNKVNTAPKTDPVTKLNIKSFILAPREIYLSAHLLLPKR
jgi:hypothetical protein